MAVSPEDFGAIKVSGGPSPEDFGAVPIERSATENIGRQIGLTGRAAISGFAALPTLLAQGASGLINKVAGTNLDPAGALQRNLTRIGFPEPENAAERIAQDVTGAMSGQAGLMKAGDIMSRAVSPVASGVGKILTVQPLAQVTGAAGSAGGAGITRELGGGIEAQIAAGLIGGMAGTAAGARRVTPSLEQQQNVTRDTVLAAGRKAGYIVPPSTINPSLTNTSLESVAGKISTEQAVSIRNQRVTDSLARKALGIGNDVPLSEQSLKTIRADAGNAYRAIKDIKGTFSADDAFKSEVAKIGGDFSQASLEFPNIMKNSAIDSLREDLSKGQWTPKGIIEVVKKLRFDASKNFKAFDDPEKAALAQAQRSAANALDSLVERNLESIGKGSMAKQYRDARVLIAKAHDVESAILPDGHVSAKIIEKIGNNGYLDGELKTIADFAGTFKKAVQNPSQIGSQNVRHLKTWAAMAGGGVGAGVGGPVGGAIGATIPFVAPPAAQSTILSRPYQSLMATPKYPMSLLEQLQMIGANPTPLANLLDQSKQ